MTMPQLAGAASGGSGHYAQPVDRLVRKEVALGSIRERPQPDTHIGIAQVAPYLKVATDDVIFDYLGDNLTEGLAPARAEDAEAELAQKDYLANGTGRASVIDWALKDEYAASDVTRYRDSLILQSMVAGQNASLSPLAFQGDPVADFRARVARDDARRKRSLDNRMEWLIMQAIENGQIVYNDGKVKFTVNFGRPADQQNQAPASGLWNTTTFDPIGDIKAVNRTMETRYGVPLRRVIGSKRALETMWKSDRFLQMIGGIPAAQAKAAGASLDLNYLTSTWSEEAAIAAVERATGVRFIAYDAFYRTRPRGSKVFTNNRFLADDSLYFFPEEGDLGEVDETAIGFAKTLTSPHPEGLWTPGFYEWEMDKQDPWQTVRGTGIKAFPVFPYMEYTYKLKVL